MGKVLIADDEPLTLRLIAHAVETTGHVAIRCSNGLRALETLIDNPDVILLITDVSMPAMRGDELAALLASEERYKSMPVIVCSGMINMADVAGLLQTGAKTCLPKPVNRELLMEAILAAVGPGEHRKVA